MSPNDSLPTAPSGEEQTETMSPEAYTTGLGEARRIIRDAVGFPFGGDVFPFAFKDLALRALDEQAARLASLSTERARMERERDEAVGIAKRASAASLANAMDNARLTSELDRVRGALEKYGRHKASCNTLQRAPFGAKARDEWIERGCDCGLDAALGVTPDATTREEG